MNQFTLKIEKQEGKYNQAVKKIALLCSVVDLAHKCWIVGAGYVVCQPNFSYRY